MKNKLLFCFIFITIIFLSGCTTSEPATEENAVSDHSSNEKKSTDNDVFSIEFNKTLISLKDWENGIDLESLLGEPISQNIEPLNGDGFTGSSLKRLSYDGLDMEMFAPPSAENEERRFWIMTMKLTKDNYQTSKGIKVGSSVQEVKDAYPGIKIGLDGRTDPNNCAYVLGDEKQYNYLLFEVKDGTVTEVNVYHLIP